MLICPSCRAENREGQGVCAVCLYRFSPGTDDIFRMPVVREDRIRTQDQVNWRLWILKGLLAVAALSLVLRACAVVSVDSRTSDRLQEAAAAVAALVDAGDPDNSIPRVVDVARQEAGCGYVAPFVRPVPQSTGAGLGRGVGTSVSSPEEEVRKEYRPDVVASAEAGAGSVVVILAAWNC